LTFLNSKLTTTFHLKNGGLGRFSASFYNSIHGMLALEGERPTSKKSQENTVFISYASEDFQQADKLYKDLKNAGMNTTYFI
jgi:hypothetical protein